MKATEVTAGLAQSNGSLLPGLWRDSLHVTCGLTACTPGSAPGPTLGIEYGKTLPFLPPTTAHAHRVVYYIITVKYIANIHPSVQDNSTDVGLQCNNRRQ